MTLYILIAKQQKIKLFFKPNYLFGRFFKSIWYTTFTNTTYTAYTEFLFKIGLE